MIEITRNRFKETKSVLEKAKEFSKERYLFARYLYCDCPNLAVEQNWRNVFKSTFYSPLLEVDLPIAKDLVGYERNKVTRKNNEIADAFSKQIDCLVIKVILDNIVKCDFFAENERLIQSRKQNIVPSYSKLLDEHIEQGNKLMSCLVSTAPNPQLGRKFCKKMIDTSLYYKGKTLKAGVFSVI